MEYHKKHNQYLNKQPEETMEQYNERIGNWEHKVSKREWEKITAYEEMKNIIRGEILHEQERRKNIEGYEEKTGGGYMLALQYMEKIVEDMMYNHQVIMEEPTKYELIWSGGDNYKLSKRS